MNFYKPPPNYSPAHIAQISRFVGYLFDPEEHARWQAWAAFKLWHHKQLVARDQARAADSARSTRREGAPKCETAATPTATAQASNVVRFAPRPRRRQR